MELKWIQHQLGYIGTLYHININLTIYQWLLTVLLWNNKLFDVSTISRYIFIKQPKPKNHEGTWLHKLYKCTYSRSIQEALNYAVHRQLIQLHKCLPTRMRCCWPGSCTRKLQLKVNSWLEVNCRIRFALVRQPSKTFFQQLNLSLHDVHIYKNHFLLCCLLYGIVMDYSFLCWNAQNS